jgi:hypothetical protein
MRRLPSTLRWSDSISACVLGTSGHMTGTERMPATASMRWTLTFFVASEMTW